MPFDDSNSNRARRPQRFDKAAPQQRSPVGLQPKTHGSAPQRYAQWLSRAADAERAGDDIQAEMCRQHAEHWFREMRGRNDG
jgi:hypothetical protein